MDRKMFDFNDYKNQFVRENGVAEGKPQVCFDTNFCNPPKEQDTQGVLTMAFVNMQPLDYVYNDAEAFKNGTLFPNINKEFFGGNLR